MFIIKLDGKCILSKLEKWKTLVMNILKKEDIDKVDPKFRDMVLDAWKNGEEVPYGVVYLSSEPPTEEEMAWANWIVKKYKIKDE
jgi:hypothetical protein